MRYKLSDDNLTYDLYQPVFEGDETIKYDEIVDTSKYIQDRESVRKQMLNPSATQLSQAVYDDEPESIDDFMLALRNGKLDKAQVHQHVLALQEQIKEQTKNSEAQKEAQERLNAFEKAIAENADKVTDNQTATTVSKPPKQN